MCIPMTVEARIKAQEKQIEMMKAMMNANRRYKQRSIFELIFGTQRERINLIQN